MNTVPNAASLPYPRLRRFGVDAAIVAGFNVVIALVITYVIGIRDSLYANLVLSMCIGMLAVTFIDGTRLLLWSFRQPPILPFILVLLVSLPLAQYLGNLSAGLILSVPPQGVAGAGGSNAAGFAVMFVLTCLGITWFFWNRERMEHLKAEAEAEKARAAEVEKRAMQAQLQLLQAQIEPHMLFNTLANLQGLIAVDAARAQRMLDQFIQYLRASLTSSRTGSTRLAQEFALLEAFLGLMQVRMGARLSYTLHLPNELREIQVPPMLLQPVVENAIRHGLEPKLDGGEITVTAARHGDCLGLTVTDTGLGLDAQVDSAGDGIGMANVRERLHALYGEHATLQLVPNKPCGVRAQLSIPL
jgi:hypothetical protein